jgi:4-carboxymuconolactone decarboxylase
MTEDNRNQPRLAPLEPPFATAVAEELARWQPPGKDPIALFRTFVRYLPLARAMHPLGRYLLSAESPLAIRDREIVIDRICARCASEYEWGVHARVFGDTAGLDESQLAAIVREGPEKECWSESDRLLIRMADELHETATISDDLWPQLARHWTEEQLLVLIALAGQYHLISFLANALRVPLEAWAPRFTR